MQEHFILAILDADHLCEFVIPVHFFTRWEFTEFKFTGWKITEWGYTSWEFKGWEFVWWELARGRLTIENSLGEGLLGPILLCHTKKAQMNKISVPLI